MVCCGDPAFHGRSNHGGSLPAVDEGGQFGQRAHRLARTPATPAQVCATRPTGITPCRAMVVRTGRKRPGFLRWSRRTSPMVRNGAITTDCRSHPSSDTVGADLDGQPYYHTAVHDVAALVCRNRRKRRGGFSYSMGTSASTFNLCAGDPVPDVSVQLAAAGGFTGLVTLSTPGLDNAVFPTATFTPNPIAPVEGGVSSVLAMTAMVQPRPVPIRLASRRRMVAARQSFGRMCSPSMWRRVSQLWRPCLHP